MNLLRKLPLMAILAIVFISIPALAQKVETDYDHAVNFTQYHTYSWGHLYATDPLYSSNASAMRWIRIFRQKDGNRCPTGGDAR